MDGAYGWAELEDVQARFWQMLGDMPPLFQPQVTLVSRQDDDGYTVERITFGNGADVGSMVSGVLLIPHDLTQPVPAVLYHHLHGNQYTLGKEELFDPSRTGIAPGLALVNAGYVVFAIDAIGFGERGQIEDVGDPEPGAATELALFKHFLWQGATLWGMMFRDDVLALNVLAARQEVDATRIAAVGMSMGGTRTTWLAALDERIKVAVPIAQLTRWADYAAARQYGLHGIYYYLPGALASGVDMEHLVSLCAPRAQAILIGGQDPLSPIRGVENCIAHAQQVYASDHAQDRFTATIYPGIGHQYTRTMLNDMLTALGRWL